jgi:hypothetical protein
MISAAGKFPISLAWIGGLVWLAALLGCDQKGMLAKFTPPAEDKLAREFLARVISSQIDEAMPLLAPAYRNADGREGLTQLTRLFAGGQTKSIEVVGVFHRLGIGTDQQRRNVQLSYQVELTNGWFAGTIIVAGTDSAARIGSARFNRIPSSLEEMNRFSVGDKGPLQWLFLAAAVLIPAFCIVSLVICIRSRIRHKWLWILFILFGLFKVSLNWTTGELDSQPVSFLLLGAACLKTGAYAPWILSVAVPVGAVLFFVKRKDLIASAAPVPSPVPPPLHPGN